MPVVPLYKRERCAELHKQGWSQRNISKELNVSRGSVEHVIRKLKSNCQLENAPKTGRPRKLTKRKERNVIMASRRNRFLTAKQLRKDCEISEIVSVDTVKRILRRDGLFGRIAVKKPFLSKKNKLKRLAWCKEKSKWTVHEWKRVVYSDECRIDLYPKCRKYVRRKANERFQSHVINPTRKFSPSVMVWGAIRADGERLIHLCNQNVDQYQYQEILRQNIKKIVSGRYLFQQDGATAHTARSTLEFLRKSEIRQLLDWPAQSPDLSPIENLWDSLKESVQKRRFSNTNELWEAVKEEWFKIPNEKIKILYESIPRRTKAVILSKGGNTKY